MSELLTAAQMRAIEQAAIESGEVTGLELMERAGQGVVEAIFEEWPEYANAPQSASVLCGPGNNGGDGFVVARLLNSKGWRVQVWFWGDRNKLSADARTNYNLWETLGDIRDLDDMEFRSEPGAAVYIDAIFGTGLSRAPEGELADFLQFIGGSGGDWAHYQARLVAIDAPSGLCLDSGRMLRGGDPFPFETTVPLCRLTVAFDSPKVGHFLDDGPEACGKLVVKDIGIRKWRETEWKPSMKLGMMRKAATRLIVREPLVKDRRLPTFWREVLNKHLGHKFAYGHALVLTGGSGKTGAARLAARGALRIGAGLVTLGVPPNAQLEVACQITALMMQRVGDATALEIVSQDERLNALCLGPGIGLRRARELVPVALASMCAAVLDADALSAYADDPTVLFDQLHKNVVLTPHGGEFARLFPDIAAKLAEPPTKGPAYSKVDATREAAARAGCVVLFKGADTVIADPSGNCSVNAAVYERAAPWLATAGSGDVLAGFVTGLLARGFAPMAAAETGAWLHVECARAFGPGLIAEDLPEMLPTVLRDLPLGGVSES
ncbi:bifunctional ADP-dependent NAD(P)H-hydrate dehydratase/NAD(P)H-hydrate epimerase [Shimia sp. NS0008-38b]|uniref:NAD(P)H-hydrate dehydratase n=1 Tax=Shimia sp. NS0008-38b TaxID=3127653 RepID=UPI00310511AF